MNSTDRFSSRAEKRDEAAHSAERHRDPLEELSREMILETGENPLREGLIKTPSRFAKAFREMTRGYRQDLEEIVNDAIFEEDYSEMVLVRDIEFSSLCEHHLLPFFGRAHIAYIPNGKIIGLSKIPRIVKMFACRLQVQERLSQEIADAIESVVEPLGIACLLEGSHMCMMLRGVQSQGSMVTTAYRGMFNEPGALREEFLRSVQR